MKTATMNNTLRPTSVMHSFNTLWQWLMAKPGQTLPAPAHQAFNLHLVGSPKHAGHAVTANSNCRQSLTRGLGAMPSRPVRVLHVVEAGQSPTQSGHLRISGRMADVCAELDRLAAREALQH